MHYSAGVALPLIPGVDGVGKLASGETVYLMAYDKSSSGTFAERANLLKEDCLPIPQFANPNTIAALVNPGTPAWLALRCRAVPKQGFSVLILGVTGTAGQLAIHISKSLGASRIVGVGRNQQMLDQLQKTGLDAAIRLGDDEQTKQLIVNEAANIDVVLDYLWGPPAEMAMSSIISARLDKTQRLDWVQCGSMAGPNINFPANVLRMSNFFISGTGIGPLTASIMRREVTELIKMLCSEELPISVDVNALANVEKVWASKSEGRQVFSMV